MWNLSNRVEYGITEIEKSIREALFRVFGENKETITIDDLEKLREEKESLIERAKEYRDHLAHRFERQEINRAKKDKIKTIDVPELVSFFNQVKDLFNDMRFIYSRSTLAYTSIDDPRIEDASSGIIDLMLDWGELVFLSEQDLISLEESKEIRFEEIDPNNISHAKAFVLWNKNPVLIKNWTLQKEDQQSAVFTEEDFRRQFSNSNDLEKSVFMIKLGEKYIGYGQFYIDHPVAISKEGRVAWPSICIGDDENRGKGLGLILCQYLLKKAKEANCTHIEAGVFEFNQEMKNILYKSGFELIGKQENKTYVDGNWWASEHYLLSLLEI